jgi:C4-dicarboxylate-specific signal transduction histidine kinase
VPAELVDKIFEPLYTTKARGIGLGLSVSRSLATANRGTLTVVNHPGGGAVFTLVLPTSESV